MGVAVMGQVCPKCGGPTWDERKSQFYKPGKPIYKCRNKECGGVIWADAAGAPTPATVAAPEADAGLVTLYERVFKRLVEFHADPKLPLVSPDTIATLAEKLAVTKWMSK